MALITTTPLFKNTTSGAKGTSGTTQSDIVDLSEKDLTGACAISYSIAGTNGGTAGSSVWSYQACSIRGGTCYAAGTFGTVNGAGSGIMTFTAVPMPFIKIQCISGTSNPALLTAELNVR